MARPAYWANNKIFINGECQKRIMVVFKTLPCRKATEKGKCFVCGFEAHTYGARDYNIVAQFKSLQDLIKRKKIEHIDILSSGSILDSKQINSEQVLRLIKEIKKLRYLKSILIEGRVEYCHVNKLQQIKQILNKNKINNNIYLEYGVGLEAWSNYVRNRILKKNLKLKDYIKCIKKLTKINVGVCTYLLAGIPRISQKNSLEETKNSAIKVVNLYKKYYCQGRIAIFPIFIALNTQLEDLYNQGRYKLITLADIIKILSEIKKKVNCKKYPIFVGLDDEGISCGRYVFPHNRKEESNLKLIKQFNYTQEL